MPLCSGLVSASELGLIRSILDIFQLWVGNAGGRGRERVHEIFFALECIQMPSGQVAW